MVPSCQIKINDAFETIYSHDTHTAVEIIASMNLGTRSKTVEIVMKLVQTVYMTGAHALGIPSANMTSRNLPNPPVGSKTAEISPPRSLPFPRPASQAGTDTAAAVNDAPIICAGIYTTSTF